MPLNGTYLGRARDVLAARREENEALRLRREREIYARLPRVKDIDERLQRQMVRLFGLTLRHGQDPTEELLVLEKSNLALQRERAALLEANGYPADYTELACTCSRCGDQGYLPDGTICACLTALYNREMTRDLSSLLQTGEERFEAFDLTLYDPALRDQMAHTLSVCRAFAEGFRPDSPSLLLQGGTGLGKTFLSACIAREIAAQGYRVVYESASAALGMFETAKFQRLTDAGAQAAERVQQYLESDLMILDDLGTEMISPYSVSALYTLINTRLTNQRSTIISTNLTDAELRQSYSPQIQSRLMGDYITLPFAGRDIRQVKKERS